MDLYKQTNKQTSKKQISNSMESFKTNIQVYTEVKIRAPYNSLTCRGMFSDYNLK